MGRDVPIRPNNQGVPAISAGLPLVNLSLLRPLVAGLERSGTEPEQVLASVGLSMEAVQSDEAAVHVLVIHQFLEACATFTGDRCFCARIGATLDPEGWPMIRDAMGAARTVSDFLTYYVTGARAVSSSVTPYLEVRGDAVIFGETRRFNPPIDPAQNDGFMVSLSLSILDHVLKDKADPARMIVVVTDPAVLPRERFQGYQILRGDRMGFRIQFPSEWLTLSVDAPARPPATPVRPAPEDFLSGFRQLLRQHIGLSGLSAEQAAHLVAMTRPQLARKLSGHATTISRELTAARVAHARAELQSTDLSVEAVAARLGYADPSNFARMFSRETGQSPSAFRAKGKGTSTRS